MHKLVLLTTIFYLLWVPLLILSKSLTVGVPSRTTATPTRADPIAEADRLFSDGEDTQRDRQALATIERALVQDTNNYQLLWRAARAYYHVGNDASVGEKRRHFERGIEVGQRAVAQQPTGVEGHFWLGAHYGGWSETQGIFRAFQVVKKVRAEMEIVLRLQASYEDSAAYLALGEMERQLPGIFGGSLKRAIAYLEQGLRVAPQNMEMKCALAKAYLEAGQREESSRQLQEILQRPVRPERARADSATKDRARQLLGK